ncbi:hypothetical protein ACIGB8_27760 [Promicromonospora sukumoe]|uniref:hypothetical protein n=1 Tax=Promicromonospora sukumoe TaxID=88382 RepID=UPI0037C4FB6E
MRTIATSSEPLVRALGVVARVLATVGEDRIETVTLNRGRISLHPHDLSEGEQIARTLGCTLPMDHRTLVPGTTDWSGDIEGHEVHIRAQLRSLTGEPA